jgi:hypothetical protein
LTGFIEQRSQVFRSELLGFDHYSAYPTLHNAGVFSFRKYRYSPRARPVTLDQPRALEGGIGFLWASRLESIGCIAKLPAAPERVL